MFVLSIEPFGGKVILYDTNEVRKFHFLCIESGLRTGNFLHYSIGCDFDKSA